MIYEMFLLTHKSIVCLLMLSFHCLAHAQKTNSDSAVTALVKLVESKTTGKRHQSYFFTFKTQEVLSGEAMDSIITSQEIYHDFGASQMLSKIYPSNKEKKSDNATDIIIKYDRIKSESSKQDQYIIKWVAEVSRRRSLERLEKVLAEYYIKKQIQIDDEEVLLKERNGKLFFSDGVNAKIAVETYSGYWIIAEVEKWKE